MIVARGGGSLADLFAFCDETLCRTVALLRVPVIASVGHHTDRTLIDDVAAVSCSTPTHAAEAAVPVDCGEARAALRGLAARLERQGRRAIVERARTLARLSRAPAEHVARHRTRLHQQLRELRASARRGDRRQADRRAAPRRPTVLGSARPIAAPARRRTAARAPSSSACAWRSRRTTRSGARARLRARRGRRRRAGHRRAARRAPRRQPRLTLRMADGTLARPRRSP